MAASGPTSACFAGFSPIRNFGAAKFTRAGSTIVHRPVVRSGRDSAQKTKPDCCRRAQRPAGRRCGSGRRDVAHESRHSQQIPRRAPRQMTRRRRWKIARTQRANCEASRATNETRTGESETGARNREIERHGEQFQCSTIDGRVVAAEAVASSAGSIFHIDRGEGV